MGKFLCNFIDMWETKFRAQEADTTVCVITFAAFAPPPQSHSLLVGFSAQDTPTSSRRKESSAPEVPVPLVEIKEEVALQLLHEQAVKWKPWSRNASSWAFFTVNDNQPVQVEKPQVLRCILCRPEAVNLDVLAQRTRARKGVITYNKSNGTTAMRKHIESEHPEIAKTYESEIENHRSMPRPLGAKKTPSQRRPKPLPLQCTSPEPLPQPIPQSTDQWLFRNCKKLFWVFCLFFLAFQSGPCVRFLTEKKLIQKCLVVD